MCPSPTGSTACRVTTDNRIDFLLFPGIVRKKAKMELNGTLPHPAILAGISRFIKHTIFLLYLILVSLSLIYARGARLGVTQGATQGSRGKP